ncbi:MAG: hypothetical protein ACI90V_012450, partial [Bacillariaceae sp.]
VQSSSHKYDELIEMLIMRVLKVRSMKIGIFLSSSLILQISDYYIVDFIYFWVPRDSVSAPQIQH